METTYSYLNSCEARLNRLLPRFPQVARFAVTLDQDSGKTCYIHAIPAERIQQWQFRNKIASDAYNQIAAAFTPNGSEEPVTIGKKYPNTNPGKEPLAKLALEFSSQEDLIMTITALERMPRHFRADSSERKR